MRELDPGHLYELTVFDRVRLFPTKHLYEPLWLRFVKRAGPGYPGNEGVYPGTNLQETLRACIARFQYLDQQIPHWINRQSIHLLRTILWMLEHRAAERHGRALVLNRASEIEKMEFCSSCGHIECDEQCMGMVKK